MPTSHWVRLIRVEDVPIGRGRFVEIGGHELAVFQLAEPPSFIVIRNSCPHAGGNLAAGAVEGRTVACPWHQWKFDLVSGACVLSEAARLTHFDTRVEAGYVLALLPDDTATTED